MKKKMIIVVPHLSTGGLPQFVVKKIELLKDSYQIKCVEYSCISHEYVIQRNRIVSLIGWENLVTLEENKGKILEIIDSFSPDIIWMEEFPEFFVSHDISKEIYKKERTYVILESTHDSSFKKSSKIWLPDKFVFVSPHNALTFYTLGVPYEIIEYPIDKSNKNKEECRKKLSLEDGWKHVVNVGLFTERKNQKYIFEIAKKLEGKKIKFHFLGNQAENFRYYWEPLMENKPSNCVVWGERDNVDDFLSAADLFLFASRGDRNNKELNPLSIKEAMEHDLPLLLFDLDVYCGKYNSVDGFNFLTGSVDDDCRKVLDILEYENNESDMISVEYNKEENKIELFNLSNSPLKYVVVVKDLLSGHTIYWFDCSFSPNSGCWCIPCPAGYFSKVISSNNFKGYEIDFYDSNREKVLFSKEIIVDEHASNFERTLNPNPFNCSYMNYVEFFSKRYLEDYNITECDVFIDAGANDGLVTEWALKKGFNKVYSIEPDKRAIKCLKEKFIDDERVIIVEKALYNANEYDVKFSTNDDSSTVTSISSIPHSNLPGDGYFLAETTRFSRMVNDYKIENISVFKIDIEGAEYDLVSDIPKEWMLKVKHFLIELHWIDSDRIDLILDLLGDEFHIEFRNHLENNARISSEDAKKLQMVTLFATNKILVPEFSPDPKIEIIASHCLSSPNEEREIRSVESISSAGFDEYRKMINPPFDGEIPVEECHRPHDISDLPGGSNLTKRHYGCYKAHTDAIMACQPQENTAYLFFECDAILTVDSEFFIEKVKESYKISKKNGYHFFSYGYLPEAESDKVDHLTSKQLFEAHSYMIPGEKIAYVQENIRNKKWDVFDLWVTYVMPPQRFGYFKDYTCLQAKGSSLIDMVESKTNYAGIEKI